MFSGSLFVFFLCFPPGLYRHTGQVNYSLLFTLYGATRRHYCLLIDGFIYETEALPTVLPMPPVLPMPLLFFDYLVLTLTSE